MIYGIGLFAFLSVIFSSPKYRWLMTGDVALSPREEKIGFEFGRYMRDAAILLLFLWLLRPLDFIFIYWGAGGLFFLRTCLFLFQMVRIFMKFK